MPEHVGVVISIALESYAREIARRLQPCFEFSFCVTDRLVHDRPVALLSAIPAGRRWVILATPVDQYETVVPQLVRAMESNKLLIAISDDPYAVGLLGRLARTCPWIVLYLPATEKVRWNSYRGDAGFEMEVRLPCAGRSMSSDQYASLRTRLAQQTPGISIQIPKD